jgi:monofunctional biosynthetic peptidoglycan transglycosylase
MQFDRAPRQAARLVALLVVSALALQLYFLLRVAAMTVVDPQSTTFQRSEAWRLVADKRELPWRHQWTPYPRIAPTLKRAVIASEDSGFTEHSGVEWDALERAWERNHKAEALAERQNEQASQRRSAAAPAHATTPMPPTKPPRAARLIGGSTITQQLAKNLFLGSERSFVRKGQEIVITSFLEVLLGKERILEIYLNNVEWGEGVFGAEAASRHYFQ